jgi:hypothetical protein
MKKERPVATWNLGRCAEQLGSAVRHLANGSGTPQKKLAAMYIETQFGRIYDGDFPQGTLRNGFQTVMANLRDDYAPKAVVAVIAAMSDEQTRKVIANICGLSHAVAYALGRQSNSA